MSTYQTLHSADEQTIEDLAGLIGVADVLEGLGAVLATDVQKDFLTTAVGNCQQLAFLTIFPAKKMDYGKGQHELAHLHSCGSDRGYSAGANPHRRKCVYNARKDSGEEDVRVLINEAGAVVDLVVNDHVQVLLSVVGSDLLEGEFLGSRHGDG